MYKQEQRLQGAITNGSLLCLQNHMPEVIVIDEIGTEAEALAARTIAQRGVQLIATAHGGHLENVIKNPSLRDLVGGIERQGLLFLLLNPLQPHKHTLAMLCVCSVERLWSKELWEQNLHDLHLHYSVFLSMPPLPLPKRFIHIVSKQSVVCTDWVRGRETV